MAKAPDAAALSEEHTEIDLGDRRLPVELFLPQRHEGPYPGVVVLHENFGLNDDIRDICRRFAENGYVAAAPDTLGVASTPVCLMRAFRAVSKGEGKPIEELEATVKLLEDRADVGKVGAAGFCMGGGYALLLGTRRRVAAAAVFYGESRPREELARACPLTGGFGGRDRIFGPKGRALIEDLDDLGVEHDIRMYEDAGHSYMNRHAGPVLTALGRPIMAVGYNEDAAEDSWRRMLAFFSKHLG